MAEFDKKLGFECMVEIREQMVTLEADLHAMTCRGDEADEQKMDSIGRTLRLAQTGAEFLRLPKIRELAYRTEGVVALVRSRRATPTESLIGLLLRATGRLNELTRDAHTSNHADISDLIAELTQLSEEEPGVAGEASAMLAPRAQCRVQRSLQMLLVEDDFSCRLLLQSFLLRYGDCHIAVNGTEAVTAFRQALERGRGYDLVCMDILMPGTDGRETVRQLRELEISHEIWSTFGARIFMTTSVDDIREVAQCFMELCDAYLVKPIDLGKLRDHMELYQLLVPLSSDQ